MTYRIPRLAAFFSLLLILLIAGCKKDGDSADQTPTPLSTITDSDAATDSEANTPSTDTTSEQAQQTAAYSDGLDENGFYVGLKAKDYVTLFDVSGFTIPYEVHSVTQEAIDSELDSMLAYFASAEHIFDRAVADGDTINIDYVGSVAGVPFEGGSTNGFGTDVTIGVTQYIEGFLVQLIGHLPGETFDIDVTFPEDYYSEELKGKAAVFNITINYIVGDSVKPELNDDFILNNIEAYYGWKTVDEASEGIRKLISDDAVAQYIYNYLSTDVVVSSVPQPVVDFLNNDIRNYYLSSAAESQMPLEDYILSYTGYDSIEAIIESEAENNKALARVSLAVQAIAEDTGIKIESDDISDYFQLPLDSSDYLGVENRFGLPYIKQKLLIDKVIKYIAENAILAAT